MVALTLANLKMMSRNRQAAFWALFFPLLLVVVFGLFDINAVGPGDLRVLDRSGSPVSQQIREDLEAINLLTVGEHGDDEAQARNAVASGDLDYLLIIPLGIDILRLCGTARCVRVGTYFFKPFIFCPDIDRCSQSRRESVTNPGLPGSTTGAPVFPYS